ncbi:MAG: hypothetical protein ACJ0Q1_01920 [Luminiphilus sp.]
MERQLPQPLLSSEERIALDAAIADLCSGRQASATADTRRPVISAIKHSIILLTLSAVALLTTHTAWMSIRF